MIFLFLFRRAMARNRENLAENRAPLITSHGEGNRREIFFRPLFEKIGSLLKKNRVFVRVGAEVGFHGWTNAARWSVL